MDVVAERRLVLRTDNEPTEVLVKLGRPVPGDTGEDWVCPYEIWFESKCRSMAMHGIDAMQALQLSIATLDVELEVLMRNRSGQLYFLDEPFVSMLECSGLKVREP
jgi:hypothetical protein